MTRLEKPRRARRGAALAFSFFTLLLAGLHPQAARAQATAASGFDNPVIPGMASDPSVVRVGGDYYLVTSTFEYFPGVPVYHSRDLVHWRMLGHVLTRPTQLPLIRLTRNGGVWAATIREHEGTFYMVTTLKTEGHGNFYVTAKDPSGPWSEPVELEQGGIDPSLFFDDDGKVYLTTGGGECSMRICQSEIDIKTGKRLSDIKPLWNGTGGSSPEGPHLYKKDGFYYLLIAEGGTEYGHMVTVARSRSPWGPFESSPRNPILTHRNFKQSPIQATGHADLVQAQDGGWWAVFHGIRPATRMAHHIGRETYVAPVTWSEDGWPVVNGTGTVTPHMDVKTLPAHPWTPEPARDNFDAKQLAVRWSFVRNLDPARFSLTERPGWLRLKGSTVTLDDTDFPPVAVLRRQQHLEAEAVTRLEFNPTREGEEAGLVLRQNERHHYEIGIRRAASGGREVYLRYRVGGIVSDAAAQTIGDGPVQLRVRALPEIYRFSYAVGDSAFRDLGGVETRYLASEVANGFNGVFLGPFATGRGRDASTPADFDWFDYKESPQPPLDAATLAEQKTLPPGYTVFSVETAERGLLNRYPYVTRLSTEIPKGVTAEPGITYARYGTREMKLDLFRPEGKGTRPAVIVVHGGAWITGNHAMENPFAAELARRGYVAATVEYRLSNEAKYPAQIHDLKAAVRFLRANAARYGIDPKRIAAVGASSGGHLVALLGATNGMKGFEGDGGNASTSSDVQAVVDIDGTATFVDPGNIEKEKKGPLDTNTRLIGATFDERPEVWREASPITHVHKGSAPVLFVNSSSYRPYQQREEMQEKLRALGITSEMVVIPDTPHPFWLFHPWFDQTIAHVEEFLKRTL
ncbi:MAG TPA: family 43 glycosylhydrolase [Pyrinomonadaceae bacterium]|nr:family 43 glycosylhydrolase [Pyrinomonadaceae bacterium]